MPHAAHGTGHVVNVAEGAAPVVPRMPHAVTGAWELVRRGPKRQAKKKSPAPLARGLVGLVINYKITDAVESRDQFLVVAL